MIICSSSSSPERYPKSSFVVEAGNSGVHAMRLSGETKTRFLEADEGRFRWVVKQTDVEAACNCSNRIENRQDESKSCRVEEKER